MTSKKDHWLGERIEIVDTLENDTEYIKGVIEAIYEARGLEIATEDEEERAYEEKDRLEIFNSKFSRIYGKYIRDFNAATKLIRESNHIPQELYPIEDPRHLVSVVYEHHILDDEEGKAFLAIFGAKQLQHKAKAHAFIMAKENELPLPDSTTKFYYI